MHGSAGRAPVYLFYGGCNQEPIKLIALLYFLMLCLANPDLQWHSHSEKIKAKLTVTMDSITERMDTEGCSRGRRRGKNNTLVIPAAGESLVGLSWCPLEN